MDIADLFLGRVAPHVSGQKESIVGVSQAETSITPTPVPHQVSKHLCGAATDLSLRCLTQTLGEVESELGGVLIGMTVDGRR